MRRPSRSRARRQVFRDHCTFVAAALAWRDQRQFPIVVAEVAGITDWGALSVARKFLTMKNPARGAGRDFSLQNKLGIPNGALSRSASALRKSIAALRDHHITLSMACNSGSSMDFTSDEKGRRDPAYMGKTRVAIFLRKSNIPPAQRMLGIANRIVWLGASRCKHLGSDSLPAPRP
jgi:hypothetical protein